jgi:dolichol-phosphate mannosyltransferase
MKIIIILPTYNEKENIGLLIDALQVQFKAIHHNMGILVVDDGSPDGTAQVVRRKIEQYPNVHMISGRKEGLGAAYVRGMKYALEVLSADGVMEMDADFSHKPEDVPRLIAALDEGADVVIGSRYIRGGRIPRDWPLLRKLISRCGNIVARYLAGLYRIRDCTAGFRAIRTSLLGRIDLSKLAVRGYAFQLVFLSQAKASHAKVVEVPVEFVDRVRGETKLGFSDIREFIKNALWIRFRLSYVFIKFCLVGTSGVFVNLSSFIILIHSGLNKYIASPVAIELSIITNFVLNNSYTFSHKKNTSRFRVKGFRFNIVSLIALGVGYPTFLLLNFMFPTSTPQIHQAIAIVPSILVNYFLNAYWTFKSVPQSNGSQ